MSLNIWYQHEESVEENFGYFFEKLDELETFIEERIEKPSDEYDKGFNRACRIILDEIEGVREDIRNKLEEMEEE